MSSYSSKSFRRSTLLYTGGRLTNAVFAFFVFLWVARYLPEQQYASYVAAFACLELGLVIFGFGMDWVTAVFVPQARLKASGKVLARFVWLCALLQLGLLTLGGCLLAFLAPDLAQWLGLPMATAVFQLYGVVLVVEGFGRVLRDQLLSSLLLQGAAQSSQLARNIVMLAFAVSLPTNLGWQSASILAIAEIAASALSMSLAAALLVRSLYRLRDTDAQDPAWSLPPWRQLLLAGRNAWISNLANLTWSGQVVVLMVARFAGAEFTAALGFARNLAEQVRRYLPMEFLLGIVRTLLIARYTQDGNARRLGIRSGIMFRINLLFLLPLLAVAIVSGAEVCSILSKGRYASSHWPLVGWLSVLVFWSHHRVTDLMAHALGRSDLSSRSSLRLLLAPVLLLLAASAGQWQYMFLTLAIAELAYSCMVLMALRAYTPNWRALAIMAGASIISTAVLGLAIRGDSIAVLMAELVVAFGIMGALIWIFKAWSPEESDVMLRSTTPQSSAA